MEGVEAPERVKRAKGMVKFATESPAYTEDFKPVESEKKIPKIGKVKNG
jgi:hypothetical protein